MRTIVWFGLVLGALSAAGKVIITKVGERVTLDCEVSSFKMLVWRHGENLIIRVDGKSGATRKGSGGIAQRSKVKQTTKLEISSVADGDAGTFTCSADATTYEHTLVLVSVSVNPSSVLQLGSNATLDCKVEPSELVVTRQWKRPDGRSPKGLPAVELQSVDRSDAGTWQCTVSYQRETFSGSLTIKIKEHAPKTTTPSTSYNSKDSRKPTCVDCDHPSSDAVLLLLGLSWWVWLAIGLGSLVVILLVVFVIIMCKRVRRRKRKFLRMKNTPLPLKPKKYCQCDCPAAAAKPQQRRRREKPSALPL
ncbi:T-cell surface glycoprotein CD4-like [Brachyistius frenatus]|uniref:T-cell surface glycoprotein CD4-like n=1 Tax=Brachyistius frenatus TaxID=100188 RepID=UPI0037E7869B